MRAASGTGEQPVRMWEWTGSARRSIGRRIRPRVLFERERSLLFAANTACRRYKGLGWSAAGNSNNMILGASKTAVLGFGKRGAGKHGESKAQVLPAERTAAQILSITVPLATAVSLIA